MKIARYILLVLLTALLVAGMLWSRGKSRDMACRQLDVEVVNDDSTTFVSAEGVTRTLEQSGLSPVGRPMWQINCDAMERMLGRSEYIESVQCYKDEALGVVHVRVQQIVPVMRVFDGDVSYYVNRTGKRMTATDAFRADVPVVEGHFDRSFSPTRLLPMIEYVESDSTLRSLVTMYCVADSNNVFIVPSIRGHVVNMGSPDGFKQKFSKLLLFYRKVMPVKGWNTYDTISVKWSHQVVATRRYSQQHTEDAYDPDDDEPAPDMEMMTDAAAPAPKPAAPEEETKAEPKKKEPKKPEAKPAASSDKAKTKAEPKSSDKAKPKPKDSGKAKKDAKPDKAKAKKDAGKKKSK